MRALKFLSYIILLLIPFLSYSQRFLRQIENDSIKYKVVRHSMQLANEKEAIPATYNIVVQLDSQQMKEIKKISKDEWIKLLSNPQKDWAANLILYFLYNRDATTFSSIIKSRKDWLISYKEKDLAYWKHFLK